MSNTLVGSEFLAVTPLRGDGTPSPITEIVTTQQIANLASATGHFLPLTGGTLTGPLELYGPPTAPTEATDKAYVDAGDATNATAITTETTRAQGAEGTLTTNLAAEVTRAEAAEALLAPLASPTFTGTVTIPAGASISGFAPLASPALTGVPTVPTASPGTNTTQAASTAFVGAAVAAATTGVSQVVGNTGNVTLSQLVTGGVAPSASPALTGTPTVPTAAANTNTTQAASTAFVVGQAASAAPLIDGAAAVGASLLYARQDHVHPTDTTRAPLASPALTGTPTVPTAAANTNTVQIASTAFVVGQAGTATPLVNGAAAVGASLLYARQDHVHPTDSTRAPLASPSLTGTPAAPTATLTDNSTTIATTAFVKGQSYVTASGAAAAAPVQSVAGRTGSVVLAVNDISGAAPLASPALSGIPTAPTASSGINSTQVATTAYTTTAVTAETTRATTAEATLLPKAGGTMTGPISVINSGHFFTNLGGQAFRLNDRLFLGTATLNDGNSTPTTMDWTKTTYVSGGVGAWEYLEQNGQFNVGATGGQLAGVFVARASDGAGGGTQATIGVSSAVLNDNTTGAGADTWCFYGTTVRAVGATGESTVVLESDTANLGSLVPLFPSAMYTAGLTANLWVAVGGELANQAGAGYTFNNTSAAIAILANNGGGYANVAFEKGIVFGATSLSASGCAIAFATGHNMTWYNTSSQNTSAISSTATTPATGQQILFSPSGMLVDDMAGATQFRVNNSIASAVNYVMTTAAATGGTPFISASGTDTNIPLVLSGKGNGGVALQGTGAGSNAGAGQVGEYLTNTTFNTPLTSAVTANATSLTLTAGDWDVSGSCQYVPAGTTTIQEVACGIATTSATLGAIGTVTLMAASFATGGGTQISTPMVRLSLAATTTVYLPCNATFGTSTMQASGFIRARRVR